MAFYFYACVSYMGVVYELQIESNKIQMKGKSACFHRRFSRKFLRKGILIMK